MLCPQFSKSESLFRVPLFLGCPSYIWDLKTEDPFFSKRDPQFFRELPVCFWRRIAIDLEGSPGFGLCNQGFPEAAMSYVALGRPLKGDPSELYLWLSLRGPY